MAYTPSQPLTTADFLAQCRNDCLTRLPSGKKLRRGEAHFWNLGRSKGSAEK